MTLDLDSYLLAHSHPPTIGKKEQEQKAKRAAERAAEGQSDAPPCKAAAPKPPAMAADILGTSSGASEPARQPRIQHQLGGVGT